MSRTIGWTKDDTFLVNNYIIWFGSICCESVLCTRVYAFVYKHGLAKAALFAGLCGGLYYAYQEYKRRTMYGGGVDFGMVKNSLGFGDSYENRRHF